MENLVSTFVLNFFPNAIALAFGLSALIMIMELYWLFPHFFPHSYSDEFPAGGGVVQYEWECLLG